MSNQYDLPDGVDAAFGWVKVLSLDPLAHHENLDVVVSVRFDRLLESTYRSDERFDVSGEMWVVDSCNPIVAIFDLLEPREGLISELLDSNGNAFARSRPAENPALSLLSDRFEACDPIPAWIARWTTEAFNSAACAHQRIVGLPLPDCES